MLSTAMDPKGVSFLLQTIKLSSGLSQLPDKHTHLHRSARSTYTHAHTRTQDSVTTEVRFKYHSTSQGRLVTFTTAAQPVPLLLSLYSSFPHPPSLFAFSTITPLIHAHLIRRSHPSLSLERSAPPSVPPNPPLPLHISFLYLEPPLTARASFHLSIRHICHSHFRPTTPRVEKR